MSDPHGHHRPSDQPQKYGSILLGAAAIFVAGWMTYESMDPRPLKKETDAGVVAPPTTSASSAAGPMIMIDASAAALDLDAGLTLPSLALDASLPSSAPRSVKIGVVFVTFAGAEGAPPNARPKGQAKEVADGLLSMARADFHQAVSKGDSGSSDDIGRIPRGVLDPAVEAAVFALTTNDVSEVIETPRGYWIVKRLD
jgi:hypothetical protein